MTKKKSNEPIIFEYGAISIDNSILKGEGFRFQSGILQQLEQFKEGKIEVVQPDVIDKECHKHLTEAFKDDLAKIEASIRRIKTRVEGSTKFMDDDAETFLAHIDPATRSKAKIAKFYEDTGVNVISASDFCNIGSIVDMYFSTTPPFETSSKKKNEFPDAIALQMLESWAERNDTKVLAVSADNGWTNYAKTSTRVDVLKSLPDALQVLQPQHEMQLRVDDILKSDFIDKSKLINIVTEDLAGFDQYSLDFGFASSSIIDIDNFELEYADSTLPTSDDGNLKLNVLSMGDNFISLMVSIEVQAEIHVGVDFQKMDPIDGDCFSISYENVSRDIEYIADVIFTIFFDSQNNYSFELDDVRNNLRFIELGSLEPNFPYWMD